jgi:hypothetical protein
MDSNKLSRLKYNLFTTLVGICLGHLLNVVSGLFMNLLKEVSMLTRISVNTHIQFKKEKILWSNVLPYCMQILHEVDFLPTSLNSSALQHVTTWIMCD